MTHVEVTWIAISAAAIKPCVHRPVGREPCHGIGVLADKIRLPYAVVPCDSVLTCELNEGFQVRTPIWNVPNEDSGYVEAT